MFERYTERARRVLFFARYEACQLGSTSIETEHVLLGLIREGRGLTSRIFARSHLSLEQIRKEIEGRVVFREKIPTSVQIPFAAHTKRVLQFTAEEADRLLHNYVGTEHLLLGILREEKCVAASILIEKGMRLQTVREDIVQLLSEHPPLRHKGTVELGAFCRDLTKESPPEEPWPETAMAMAEELGHVLSQGKTKALLLCQEAEVALVARVMEWRRYGGETIGALANAVLLIDLEALINAHDAELAAGTDSSRRGLNSMQGASTMGDFEAVGFFRNRVYASQVALDSERKQFELRVQELAALLVDNADSIALISGIDKVAGRIASEAGYVAARILRPALANVKSTWVGATTHDNRKLCETDVVLSQAVIIGNISVAGTDHTPLTAEPRGSDAQASIAGASRSVESTTSDQQFDTHFDVFISFKAADASGRPTEDARIARIVYEHLSTNGLKAFFSDVSLQRSGESAYKKVIDRALDTASVLVAIGTSGQNLNSEWVKYEWDGFFSDVLSGVKPNGRVFVYTTSMEVHELPRSLRNSQIIRHDDHGLEVLCQFIRNALTRDAQA